MMPPGHVPGFHVPGTLTPIGAVVQAHQEAIAAETARRRRRNLLLLLRP